MSLCCSLFLLDAIHVHAHMSPDRHSHVCRLMPDVLAADLCVPHFTGEVCEAAAAAAGPQWSHPEGSGAAD